MRAWKHVADRVWREQTGNSKHAKQNETAGSPQRVVTRRWRQSRESHARPARDAMFRESSGSVSSGLSTWKSERYAYGTAHTLRLGESSLSHRSFSSPALLPALGTRHTRERNLTGRCNIPMHLEHSALNRNSVLISPPRVRMADWRVSRPTEENITRAVATPRPLSALPDVDAAARKELLATMVPRPTAGFVPKKIDYAGMVLRAGCG